MPCYRCGARQTDPVRGPSPWKRGVRAGEQVLVCPDCQQVHDWTADMQSCPACGSVRLSRVLGQTRCSACGHAWDDGAPETAARHTPESADLEHEVDAAIGRLLRGDSGS
jgi:ribosomal protein L37AE/L43A